MMTTHCDDRATLLLLNCTLWNWKRCSTVTQNKVDQ